MTADGTLYDRLGVERGADLPTLRAAYRRRARELHPDLHPDHHDHHDRREGDPVAPGGPASLGDRQLQMALVNEAWAVLSDPARRQAYDRSLVVAAQAAPSMVVRPAPPRRSPVVLGRKEAWIDGVRVRIRFLGTMAGRSAVQTLLLRHPGTARDDWDAALPPILEHLTTDAGERVRQARVAGAAPLDLANAAALIGLASYGDELVAGVGRGPVADDVARRALLVDRMFDTLAHELPRGLVRQLGDNPKVARRLGLGRR